MFAGSSSASSSASSGLDVLKVVEKKDNNNLIDLTPYDLDPEPTRDKGVRVSLLEAFDPLLLNSKDKTTESISEGKKNLSVSLYHYNIGEYCVCIMSNVI